MTQQSTGEQQPDRAGTHHRGNHRQRPDVHPVPDR
jgi:hypothetical protein